MRVTNLLLVISEIYRPPVDATNLNLSEIVNSMVLAMAWCSSNCRCVCPSQVVFSVKAVVRIELVFGMKDSLDVSYSVL